MGSKPRKRRFWYHLENGQVRVETREKTVVQQAQEILEEITRSQVQTMTRINGARPQRSKRLQRKTPIILEIERQTEFFAPYVKETEIYKRTKIRKEFVKEHGRLPARRKRAR